MILSLFFLTLLTTFLNFRLGFGSFVDKTVMPYISMLPGKLENPCQSNTADDPGTTEVCVKTYGFHNDLPLTSDTNQFHTKVNVSFLRYV